MTRTVFVLAAAAFLPILAAASTGPAPVDSLEAFARAVDMKKGAWRTRITITRADLRPSPPAAPADVAKIRADLDARLGKVRERSECLDPGSKDRLRLPGIVIDSSCSASGMTVAGGRWTLDSTCSDPAKGEYATMKGQGVHSRKAVAGRHEGQASMRGVAFDIAVEFESRHVGRCAASRPVK